MAKKRLERRDLRLPQELVDAIILELRDDAPSLTACSKTARAFRIPCQRRIFRELMIDTEESGYRNNYQRASELLASSPHLEAYVRKLTTTCPTEQKDICAFESVLRVLRSVRRLTISGPGSLVWRNLSSDFTSALFDFMTLSPLDRVNLMNMVEVPSSLVCHAASSTRVLELNAQSIHEDSAVKPSPPKAQLEHLIFSSRCVHYRGRLIAMLGQAGYLGNTRRLSISLAEWEREGVFDSLPATLRHLEINYNSFTRFRHMLAIPKIVGLQVLELGVNLSMSRSPPQYLGHILSKLPEFAPLVERIVLKFTIIPCIPEAPWIHHGVWPVFDVGFVERRQLPRLRNVTCCLQLAMDYFYGDDSVSYEGFVAAMERKLPGLTGTNMLAFTRGNGNSGD
ncbi:hypothetical protein DFH08DRAFT_853662 [Mycena albidolilacea]|uniref:F-box domain-containing protein n=1 Tax=Mycena albidolilacea TaxID=1033008 RepID=A0AAD7ADI0_9AGAR|nr:hypothetical protein DFH08DRAFT_853662 [Mycena albidolilacea]